MTRDFASLLGDARALSGDGAVEAALAACEQAIAVWPDIRDAYRLRLQFARDTGDRARILDALEILLRHDADDADSCAELGRMLCEDGAFDRAAALLRPVAARLGDRGDAVALFATALAGIGAWGELRALAPLLDRVAATAPSPFAPYALLAVARLAGAADRAQVLADLAALQASPRWLGPDATLHAVSGAISTATPFSILRFDGSIAGFAASCGRTAGRLLRPEERQAMLDQTWGAWFGTSCNDALLPGLRNDFTAAIADADIVAMPDTATLEADHARFGVLAEMHRLVRVGTDARFADSTIGLQMHRAVPYLRTALCGLPFLGFVGAHPAMFRKLAHFCGVAETRLVPVPREAAYPVPENGIDPAGFMPDGHAATLAALSVPFPGAVFLVSAPGPLGPIYAGRIKALGGIALDLGPLAAQWAGA